MKASLRGLLIKAIDYAGPFPPSQLSLKDALAEYWASLSTERAYFINRFCCPAKDLPELASLLGDRSIPVSVIGAASSSEAEWEDLRAEEARLMTDFQNRQQSEIQAYEVRIPSNERADDWYDKLKGFSTVDVFAELPWDSAISDSIPAAADHEWILVKARTGGSFVPSAALAEFIWHAMSIEIPFKLTGGLHHPIRIEEEHGFVNVLTASALAYAADFGPQQLVEVLDCRDPGQWQFDEDGFAWAGEKVSLQDTIAARTIVAGFGSCSVSEPLEGLSALGWM